MGAGVLQHVYHRVDHSLLHLFLHEEGVGDSRWLRWLRKVRKDRASRGKTVLR